MKSKKNTAKIMLLSIIGALLLIHVSCNDAYDLTEHGEPSTPVNPVESYKVDPAFWFMDIYENLIIRTGSVSIDDYTGATGDTSGLAAHLQYVCTAINNWKGSDLLPEAGTETQAASCEYLLKMIDKANNNSPFYDSTSYGTSCYATTQVIDVLAVNNALEKIKLFQPQSWSIAGSYSIELPPGRYKMTAVSGKGGNGGNGAGGLYGAQSGGNGGTGGKGMKGTQLFTIPSTVTVTVIVGDNGGDGGDGSYNNGNKGAGGGGGGGSSGIVNYFHVIGGGGGGGGGGAGTVSYNKAGGSGTGAQYRWFGGNGGIMPSAYGNFIGGRGGWLLTAGGDGGQGGDGNSLRAGGSQTLLGGDGGMGGNGAGAGGQGGYGYGGGGGGGGGNGQGYGAGGGGGAGGNMPGTFIHDQTDSDEAPYVAIEIHWENEEIP